VTNAEVPVGIDLGTTNSLVGAIIDGKATIFTDASGAELLPSVVGSGPGGEIYVGRAAKNRRLLDPAGTVVSVKRRMGTDARFKLAGRELSAAQVSALILGALLDRAEAALGHRPRRAVITVPAYFTDAQRQATRDAGEIAGLAVDRLVNEPTAAALNYRTGSEELVMVYDLGGGTFDVSILERDEGMLEVRTSRGDTHLGGDDIDQALTALVLGRLGPAREKAERDPRAMTRLVEAVERAKIALSDREEVRLFDPFLAGEGADAVHLDLPLTRADVEEVARPFVQRTLACIDDAMRDAGIHARDPHRVLLVGGASRMPLVQRMVEAHLLRPAQVDPDAERAVALGASLLAGRIGGADVDEVLVDITPHTLAVGVLDPEAFMTHDDVDEEMMAAAVIPRDTVVPVERKRTVYTISEDQPAAELPIVQGEHRRMLENTPLGMVRVGPLPPGPAGAPVEVSFKLDLSGVLHVHAQHLPSGKSAEVEIADSPYKLTQQRRTAARAEVEELRARAPEEAEEGLSASDLSLAAAMLGRARRALEKGAGEDEEARERAREATAALEAAVARKAPETMDLCDALSDALLDLV
jgi:molecular chaperone DnaK